MTGELTIGTQGQLEGNRWGIMLAISLIMHLSVFSAVIFLPGIMPSKEYAGVVYEVDLVQMPSSGVQVPAASKAEETVLRQETSTKRIESRDENKASTEIEKISLSKKTAPKKEETSPSKLIDNAISKTEKKVKAKDTNYLNKAISDLRKKTQSEENQLDEALSQLQDKAGGTEPSSGSRTGSIEGLPIRLYQIEVKDRIKGNWAYPAAMQNRQGLEATILLKVKADGTILASEFRKKSGDSIFDQSVLKAIEKSNPLPPFPEGYRKSYEELEINFTLKELLDY